MKESDESEILRLRKAIEHRATWMGLMCMEAEKAGADWESIARKAVRKTGNLHGEAISQSIDGETDLLPFAEAFLPERTKKIFDMDVKENSSSTLRIEFNYCPLVKAWKKLGIPDEKIKILCDIAMDGDRGIAEEAGFDFTLGRTIAQGHSVCEVCFQKKLNGSA